MTSEEVLQRANDYCNERSYDIETLTEDFRNKFAVFFAKRHEEAGIDDEGILDELKFNIDTARSAATRGRAAQQSSFESKENDYKNQIAELNKKLKTQPHEKQVVELPEEVKNQLAELQKFKSEEAKKAKFNEIVSLAKKDIREDCVGDFDIFVKDYEVKEDMTSEEQAKRLHARFQEIFRSKIGDIKPLAPKQVQKQEDEFIESIGKVKI